MISVLILAISYFFIMFSVLPSKMRLMLSSNNIRQFQWLDLKTNIPFDAIKSKGILDPKMHAQKHTFMCI